MPILSHYQLKSMFQHESLHLAVVPAAPVRSCKEGPTDFNDATVFIVSVVAGRSNYFAVSLIYSHKRATGAEGLLEESPECWLLIAVMFWVLFPDERIRRDPEQRVEVVRPQWTEREELSNENGLSIK
jgi:hypothetical protein